MQTTQFSRPSIPTQPSNGPSQKGEFNVMMATRYALDAIIGNAAGTPKEAAELIRDIYKAFQETKEEPAKEAL